MELNILKDIVIIFALSTGVNYLFTKVKIPTIIGYLITGIIAGPHVLGIIGKTHDIELMAEIGVVLLMFTIGLEFSLNHLLRIRKIVFWGGFVQLTVTAGTIMLIGRMYDLDWKASLFIGFLTALSSTAVVLKLLQERSELTSNYGRTVVGILIFQDIVLVPLLLFTPLLGSETTNISSDLFLLIIKTVGIIIMVYAGNKWIVPKLLHLVAMTKNQEVFLMSILLICLSVALLTSELGMSLAFGAFLAGLMISESEYSHNAFGNLIPFKDTFASFFFVSIGILLDLNFVFDNWLLVVGTVLMVITIKMIIGGFTSFILGHTFKGTILVGIAISQVGEFSFILAKLGMNYDVLNTFYYQLFLAVAIITMSVTPFMIQVASPLANILLKLPLPKLWVNGLFPLPEIELPKLSNHLVLIGKDTRALNLSIMAKHLKLPYVSIVFDPATVRKRQQKGEMVVYGDAINDPILKKAHIDTAEVVVISIGDLITCMAVVEKVRTLNQHAHIIVRTRMIEDIEELYKIGANEVIPEEFETAIELFKRVLRKYLMPYLKIREVVAEIRTDHYGMFRELSRRSSEAKSVMNEFPNIEVIARKVGPNCSLVGKTLLDIMFRKNYGVTLVAIKRGTQVIDHPELNEIIQLEDIIYLLGKPDQIASAMELFNSDETSVIPIDK